MSQPDRCIGSSASEDEQLLSSRQLNPRNASKGLMFACSPRYRLDEEAAFLGTDAGQQVARSRTPSGSDPQPCGSPGGTRRPPTPMALPVDVSPSG